MEFNYNGIDPNNILFNDNDWIEDLTLLENNNDNNNNNNDNNNDNNNNDNNNDNNNNDNNNNNNKNTINADDSKNNIIFIDSTTDADPDPDPNHNLDNFIKNGIRKLLESSQDNEKTIEMLAETNPYLSAYLKHVSDFEDPNIKWEPILSTTSSRYTVYPIIYQEVWENYKDQLKLNWVVEEIDLSKDVVDWINALSKEDRTFIMHVLAFFAAADGIVNDNVGDDGLSSELQIKEGKCAYAKQVEMENTHGEMYSLLIDTLIKNPTLKDKLINSIKTMPSIKRKAEWAIKWKNNDTTFAHKLVANAIIEAIFFSGSFASIFWLKTRHGSIMRGLIKSNKFIARDENKHVELACILYSLLKNKLKESIVQNMINDAIIIEDEFINNGLPGKLIGMNAKLMSQYIRYCGDRLLRQLGYKKLYNVTNPFEFMNKIGVFSKDNFFEERNDAYTDSKIDNERTFKLLSDGY